MARIQTLNGLRTRLSQLLLIIADVTALVSSLVVSLLLRFDAVPYETTLNVYLKPHLLSFAMAVACYIGIFHAFRLYRYAWRFASIEILWSIVICSLLGLMSLIALQMFIDGSMFPRSVLVMFWTRSLITIGGLRVLMRLVNDYCQKRRSCAKDHPEIRGNGERIIILGGGQHGVTILRAFRDDRNLNCDVIGFLDDDPCKVGTFIGNVQVLGPISHLSHLISAKEVDEVIVALPEISRENQKHILACRRAKVSVKVVPRLRDVLSGKTKVFTEDFSVEDLLRRAPRRTDIQKIGDYVTGKRVLVTGAGGSIGSELCRQIVALRPASLVLVGHGENSIFDMRNELQRDFPTMAERIYWVIASVSDEHRVKQVFESFRPEVVFHAAAHKHVPIMESNLLEAVQNNVVGTRNIARACGKNGVDKMVLISTDKAANPSSVMGATKFLCEKVLCAAAKQWESTSYVTVRFGNVLGSRGSVVPIFRKQIEQGGPVTVTHPEMTRYFMTIPEAVRLVLQAGAVGKSGDLYLLDMGEPVKIVDLARDMIRLYGLEPDVDIPIQFSGIRSGEKLHEKLTSDDEGIEPAKWDGLFTVHRNEQMGYQAVEDLIAQMKGIIQFGDETSMMSLMCQSVPGFAVQGRLSVNSALPDADNDLLQKAA